LKAHATATDASTTNDINTHGGIASTENFFARNGACLLAKFLDVLDGSIDFLLSNARLGHDPCDCVHRIEMSPSLPFRNVTVVGVGRLAGAEPSVAQRRPAPD
jgi:hypothetical protein